MSGRERLAAVDGALDVDPELEGTLYDSRTDVPEDPNLTDIGAAMATRLGSSLIEWNGDFWDGADDAEDWLVAPFLARGRGHLLYAPAKAGKSLLALWVVACAALGRACLDQPAGSPLRILYCDLEMTRADVRERLVDMGLGPDDHLENLVYYSLPSLAALDTAAGGAELVALALHHEVDLVVIDTIGRVLNGEENSNDTAQGFARFTGTPLKAAGITLLRVDHAGKDAEKGTRGASAKVDDVDVVWKFTPRDHGSYNLNATHQRMAWVPKQLALEKTAEPLGYKITDGSWPAGTATVAALLDRLGVPLDHGKTKARQAIKVAGEAASNEALAAALRYRRANADLGLELLPGGQQ